MLRKILGGIAAGIMIAIGGSVYLSCDNKYVGAVFFSVALLCICLKGYSLFTGKVGFMPEKHGKEEWSTLLLGLFGNVIATALFGFLIRYAITQIGVAAETVCAAKLSQALPSTFIRSVMCGILMYLAVSIYRDKNNIFGIFFCVPVFILSGFEHSIANMFYFAAAGIVSFEAFIYILVVVVGNALGGILLPCLCWRKKDE